MSSTIIKEVSNCCGARVEGSNGLVGKCSECGENCTVEARTVYEKEDVQENPVKIWVASEKQLSIYDLVLIILRENEQTRSDDKLLLWEVFIRKGYVQNGVLDYEAFCWCPTPETVTRARRKVQQLHPELIADRETRRHRREREEKKGNFIFNEKY